MSLDPIMSISVSTDECLLSKVMLNTVPGFFGDVVGSSIVSIYNSVIYSEV